VVFFTAPSEVLVDIEVMLKLRVGNSRMRVTRDSVTSGTVSCAARREFRCAQS